MDRGAVDPCVLLTGLARGGTTLSCELLNRVPAVCALDEPMDPNQLARAATRADGCSLDPAIVHAGIEAFAAEQRQSILTRGVALSRHVDGRVRGAEKVSDSRGEDGLRVRMAARSEIPFAVPPTPDFTLVIKHPVAFTALLPILRERFPVFAIVRNPLSVLASWESVPMHYREGRLGLRTVIAPALAARLDGIADRTERELTLLEWFFSMYASTLPREHVIRYEDIVSSGGTALAPIAPAASELRVQLRSRNATAVYDGEHIRRVGPLLLEREGAHWLFYTREEVRAVIDAADGAR